MYSWVREFPDLVCG